MSALWYSLLVLGVGLETVLLWRTHKGGMWRHYPFFVAYVLFVLLRTLVLFAVMQLRAELYSVLYWRSEILAVALWFLITWEVFRQSFPKWSAIYRVASNALLVVLYGSAITLVVTGARLGRPLADRVVYPLMERSLGCTQAISLLLLLILARYYGVSMGRNVRGIAVGFGMFVSISVANFSALELLTSFVPYWRLVRPLSFLGMLVIWTCALWTYAPNPSLSSGEIPGSHMKQWGEAWSRTLSVLRKVIEP